MARAHGVNANQVFGWRRLYRQGLLESSAGESAQLLPVCVSDAARDGTRPRSTARERTASGFMHLEFPKGQLRIAGRVDAEALRVVLEKLLG